VPTGSSLFPIMKDGLSPHLRCIEIAVPDHSHTDPQTANSVLLSGTLEQRVIKQVLHAAFTPMLWYTSAN
jgi:hypothetical protein